MVEEAAALNEIMHIGVRTAFLALAILGPYLLFATGCDTFGLPPYSTPGVQQPVGSGSDQADILDINPKFGRVGEETQVAIIGINTTFTDTTVVVFPDEPEIQVLKIAVEDPTNLTAYLSIGIRAIPGQHVLQVTTDADGTLEYRDGFYVVE